MESREHFLAEMETYQFEELDTEKERVDDYLEDYLGKRILIPA